MRISWAGLDGAIVHIRNIPDGGSKRCTCLVCGNPMVARRGGKRQWHFAHAPGAPPCPLHSEEVLRRFEAIMHLHGALQATGRLRIRVTCRSAAGRRDRHVYIEADWVDGWDQVQVNVSADSQRPDLTLLRADQLVAAIEVRGSAPVGAGKEAVLADLDAPWSEVFVNDALQWLPSDALTVYRLEPEGWLCPICSAHQEVSRTRGPTCEVHEARISELREQGLLRPLWQKDFRARHGGRDWSPRLEICDLLDGRGLPLHRLMVDVDYGYVVSAVTAEEFVSDVISARQRFKDALKGWLASLRAVSIGVDECERGWTEVGHPDHLFDTEGARKRLRQMLQELAEDPAVEEACQILGVSRADDVQSLKAARRRLAKKWHPDLASEEELEAFTAMMQDINAAFDVLSALVST